MPQGWLAPVPTTVTRLAGVHAVHSRYLHLLFDTAWSAC